MSSCLVVRCLWFDWCWTSPSMASMGGGKDPRGRLTDRFEPASITRWMTSKDLAARDCAFAAILDRKRLDIAALRVAFEGIR